MKEQIQKEIVEGKKFFQRLEKDETFYDFRDELEKRVVSNIKEPPEVIGGYEYSSNLRFTNDASYHVMIRKDIAKGTQETVFDPLKDAPFPKKYLNTHSMLMTSLNDDQTMLAVAIDVKSNELPTGYLKDLTKGGRLLSER